MVFEGLGKKKVDEVPCGEICAIMGIEGFEIGDTICDYENPGTAAPHRHRRTDDVDALHDQQLAVFRQGRQIRHLAPHQGAPRPRTGENLALRVTPGPSADSFNVFGRGVLHLSVLIETMRREG